MTRRAGQRGAMVVRPRTRRGSVYVLVLGASLMVVVGGVGAVMLSRAHVRAATAARDWAEAGTAAKSGVEYAVAWMNATPTWRTLATNNKTYGTFGIGRAKVCITLSDAVDTNLTDDPTQPVKVYATATVGSTTRCFGATAAPASSTGYDVLRCAVASASGVSVTGNAACSGGPAAANGTLSVSSGVTLTGDAEASSVSSNGFIAGYVQTGVAVKSMPDLAGWNALTSAAKTIPYVSTIDRVLLSPKTNTLGGGTSATGVYAITVPAASTLTIRRSRFVATLLVTLGAGSQLIVKDEVLWDPGATGQPALIVQGGLLSSVSISGSTSQLSEAANLVNYNPGGAGGTPYNGVGNSTTTDVYPSELHGLYHIYSNIPVQLGDDLTVVGCVVAGGAVTVTQGCQLTAPPSLKSNPPSGYGDPVGGKMLVSPGSWQWVVDDVNASVTP